MRIESSHRGRPARNINFIQRAMKAKVHKPRPSLTICYAFKYQSRFPNLSLVRTGETSVA